MSVLPLKQDEIRLAMLGMVEGNGHPYSWSIIFNGRYDLDALNKCPYPGIRDYIVKQPPGTLGIPGAKVTHVWTDDPADAVDVAKVALIPNVVARPEDVIGKVDERMIVRESGVPYEVHPLAGLNVGLFTDMREQRLGLPRFAPGQRVLNLFSYTGALGLACARAGAASVTNVDTSQGVLAWAKGNYDRSQVPGRFEAGDARRFLTRAARDKERYDLVLVDPPGASSAAGVSWALGRDYPDLIAKAAAVIPPDGLLWLASNAADVGALSKLAHKGLRAANRTGVLLEQAGLPPEYPTLVAQPSDRYLQVCLLRLS